MLGNIDILDTVLKTKIFAWGYIYIYKYIHKGNWKRVSLILDAERWGNFVEV